MQARSLLGNPINAAYPTYHVTAENNWMFHSHGDSQIESQYIQKSAFI